LAVAASINQLKARALNLHRTEAARNGGLLSADRRLPRIALQVLFAPGHAGAGQDKATALTASGP
jgi:hypothetical protein